MHGLINRSIQCFLRDTYGPVVWRDIARSAAFEAENFEALLQYDNDITDKILNASGAKLGKALPVILEDLGTYLISNPNVSALRRLLRFGGTGFTDFLHSLDDLQGRAKLAVPELEMPTLTLRDHGPGHFTLYCNEIYPGTGFVMVGILRAMADDYGALVLLDHMGAKAAVSTIAVQVLDADFTSGREFSLVTGAA